MQRVARIFLFVLLQYVKLNYVFWRGTCCAQRKNFGIAHPSNGYSSAPIRPYTFRSSFDRIWFQYSAPIPTAMLAALAFNANWPQ
jgi:hypothetical protein